ncbi:MAG: crossover junction endodeoxyribonuclease RuvC [Candidatus Marinimicrobia bacterium]|nr:crossover junction endodeoxyribonuclease RuvC [Candidatus Neomarinimicrobiota bacterium]|tara:strand:- start:916 stop:1389 length:474 start_codon:yes stop_codon:yes gene_type:complete
MKIIGIDPGLACTGFGIIEVINNNLNLIDYGTVKTDSKEALNIRLNTIYDDLKYIIKKYKPKVMSVEQIFYGKNVKSALLLGHSRGVPLLLSAKFSLALYEFSARRIKQSLTGNGNATKEQVQFMVKNLLSIDEAPNPTDASDALAAAICYNQNFRI